MSNWRSNPLNGTSSAASDKTGTFVLLNEKPKHKLPFKCEGKCSVEGFKRVKSSTWGGHERCVSEWLKLVAGLPAKVVTSGKEVRGTVEVAEAAYKSVTEKRTIKLPLKPRPWKKSRAEFKITI